MTETFLEKPLKKPSGYAILGVNMINSSDENKYPSVDLPERQWLVETVIEAER